MLSYAQLQRDGVRSLETDDYLMVLATIWYSLLVATFVAIVEGGGSNLFLPEELDTFTQEEVEDRIFRSKLVVMSEQVCSPFFRAHSVDTGPSFVRAKLIAGLG